MSTVAATTVRTTAYGWRLYQVDVTGRCKERPASQRWANVGQTRYGQRPGQRTGQCSTREKLAMEVTDLTPRPSPCVRCDEILAAVVQTYAGKPPALQIDAARLAAPKSAILSRTERTTRSVIESTSVVLSTFRGLMSDRTWMERYLGLLRAITLSATSSKPARTPILGLAKRLLQFERKNPGGRLQFANSETCGPVRQFGQRLRTVPGTASERPRRSATLRNVQG
ncbi:MAG: hypothetical protein QOD67_4878 [Caballeronia sp.]|jgi:hypothetical protein|nr:hypothetical protein [Caballeronia sp.]